MKAAAAAAVATLVEGGQLLTYSSANTGTSERLTRELPQSCNRQQLATTKLRTAQHLYRKPRTCCGLLVLTLASALVARRPSGARAQFPAAGPQRAPLALAQHSTLTNGGFLNSMERFVGAQLQQQQQQGSRQARFVSPPQEPFGGTLPMRLVPGEAPFKVPLELVLPYENFRMNMSAPELAAASYVIDNKRYVEAVPTRCFASTILEDPEVFEPSFVIIRPQSEVRLNATSPAELIRLAGFEAHKRTTIMVHGFTQSYPNTTWLRRVRALFEANAVVARQNLIIMDWGVGSQGSYGQVAARVSGMASYLAHFITKLLELGADRMGVHLIGHSLGAHLAGFAGKRIRPRLGRITGLDPAGPCFGKLFSNSPQDRLSADDAFEVDVYHYDDNFLGLPGQHGQFDVYVNGGSSQPGCKDDVNAVFQALITMVFRRNRVLSESHTRSTEVPSVQLEQLGCQQVAYECKDYATFLQGECGHCDHLNSQCFFMGFSFQYAPRASLVEAPLRTSFPGKRLYIVTGPAEPLCLHHYQALARLELSAEQAQLARRNKWRLQVELLSDSGKRVDLLMANQMAPGVFSYLLLTDKQPQRFKAARLQVRAADGTQILLLGPGLLAKKLAVPRALSLEVNFMSHIEPETRRALSSRLCPVTSTAGALVKQPAEANAIADGPEAWLYFEECLSNWPPGS